MNDSNFMEKFLAEHKTLQADRKIVLDKIQYWLDSLNNLDFSKIEKKQKTKEIIDVGNFLYYLDEKIKIENALTERPDFIVSKENNTIGIELKDLIIQDDEKEKEGIYKSLFEQIESELKIDTEKYKGQYRVEFKKSDFTLKAKDKNQIKKEIISTIKGENSGNEYIEQIIQKPYSGINIYKGETTIVGHLERKTVVEKIKSTDEKFDDYDSEKLDEIWLLLVIGGVEKSSDYSFFEESIMLEPFKSNFQRIFIYDFFSRQITELKVTPHNRVDGSARN